MNVTIDVLVCRTRDIENMKGRAKPPIYRVKGFRTSTVAECLDTNGSGGRRYFRVDTLCPPPEKPWKWKRVDKGHYEARDWIVVRTGHGWVAQNAPVVSESFPKAKLAKEWAITNDKGIVQ